MQGEVNANNRNFTNLPPIEETRTYILNILSKFAF